jgi:trimeric autotransporter adhesin
MLGIFARRARGILMGVLVLLFSSFAPIVVEGAVSRAITTDGWVDLGGRMETGWIRALAVGSGETVYAGGLFSMIDGVAANNVARWTPRNGWQALGNGLTNPDGGSAQVTDLEIGSDGSLYAIGTFTRAGNLPANKIARWTGNDWVALGDANHDINAYFMKLLVGTDGSLYVKGSFNQIGGVQATNLARWTGSHWEGMQGTFWNNGDLLMTADGILHTAEEGQVYNWNGTSFSGVASTSGPWSARGSISALVESIGARRNSAFYIGGYFSLIQAPSGDVQATNVAHWTGTRWEALGNGVPGGISKMAIGPSGNLNVAGLFVMENGDLVNYMRWNGTNWNAFGGTNTGCGAPPILESGNGGNLYTLMCYHRPTGEWDYFVARWEPSGN